MWSIPKASQTIASIGSSISILSGRSGAISETKEATPSIIDSLCSCFENSIINSFNEG